MQHKPGADRHLVPCTVQRQTLTYQHPETGERGLASVVDPKAYEEWQRRKEGGGDDEDDRTSVFPAEMETMERGYPVGSEAGDE